jgi:hypothetical protein
MQSAMKIREACKGVRKGEINRMGISRPLHRAVYLMVIVGLEVILASAWKLRTSAVAAARHHHKSMWFNSN